mgnify:CR=1 FL=1
MARLARVVASGYPHHVTHRGNRCQQTFFFEEDYREYMRLMSASCARTGTEVWAYCQMRNHVHLVMVPQHPDGVRSAISEAHRRFTAANCPEYLSEATDQSLAEKIDAHTRTGWPLGGEAFVGELEAHLDHRLRPQKRGPKPRSETGE